MAPTNIAASSVSIMHLSRLLAGRVPMTPDSRLRDNDFVFFRTESNHNYGGDRWRERVVKVVILRRFVLTFGLSRVDR